MSDPNEAPSTPPPDDAPSAPEGPATAPPSESPAKPEHVDPDTGTDPDGTPTENPSGG